MSRTRDALILAAAMLAIAILAVFDVIPAHVAQYAPLAVVPFVIGRRRSGCGSQAC